MFIPLGRDLEVLPYHLIIDHEYGLSSPNKLHAFSCASFELSDSMGHNALEAFP